MRQPNIFRITRVFLYTIAVMALLASTLSVANARHGGGGIYIGVSPDYGGPYYHHRYHHHAYGCKYHWYEGSEYYLNLNTGIRIRL